MKSCINKKENEKDCPCKEIDCEYHGICCECLNYHKQDKTLPMCLRKL